MNDTDVMALVDTTRDELRERIALALARFERVARVANPLTRPPRSAWTVQQTVAHVLSIAHRYLGVEDGTYHLADTPRQVTEFNQAELDTLMAPLPELVDQLVATAPRLDDVLDTYAGEGRVLPFHCGGAVDGISWQTNWLGELRFHGHDIARAAKLPWEMPERDMLLIARGLMQIAPAFVSSSISPDTDIRVTFLVPTARPYLMHVRGGGAEARPSRPGERADAVLRLPASTLMELLYKRSGPVAATFKGLRIVGGRRPWLALKLQSCFDVP